MCSSDLRKSGGNTENQFDYWLINKDNVLIAGLDIAQSQISEFSQKWGHQCKMMETKLNANNLSIAFLINKEGRKYSFSNLSNIMGSFIENIPEISLWDEHLKMFSLLSKYKKDLEEQKKATMELQKIKESFLKDLQEDYFQEDLTIPELKDDIKNSYLFPVDSCGLGALLIHRSIFIELVEKYGYKHLFLEVQSQDNHSFFIGEDVVFCNNIKSLGYEILINTKVKPKHLKTISIDENYYLNNMQ